MDVQQLDAVVRVSALTLLLLAAAVLSADRNRRRLSAFFTPLAICLCGFLIGNTPDPALRLSGPAGEVAHMLSGYGGVFLWWFCLAAFDRTFRPAGPVLALGVVWLLLASADRGLLGPDVADKGISWLLVAMGFGMVAHLVWRIVRDRRGDLLEARRDMRLLVAALLGGELLLDLTVDVAFGFGWRPRAFAIAQNAGLLAFALLILVLMHRARGEALAPGTRLDGGAGVARLRGGPAAVEVDAGLIERLRRLVEVERVHLDPAMTFEAFAQRMGASERTVRRLINQHLGHEHFRSFLNVHRIGEARRLLADPRRADDKLIAIALDSGFASLASFNRVFRATQACTPSAYRNDLRTRTDAVCAAGPGSDQRFATF